MTKQNWLHKMVKKNCFQMKNPMNTYWVVVDTKIGAVIRHRRCELGPYKNIRIQELSK